MRPLTLIPKFDIVQAKYTSGFTQTTLISMKPKIALATVVYCAFLTNPNYQQNQIILIEYRIVMRNKSSELLD